MESKPRTPYCHMIYENSKQKQMEVRLELVRYAQKHGIKPTSRKFHCSKNSVRLWKRRYESFEAAALLNKSRRPLTCPHQTSKNEEAKIIECRQKAPCYGPKRLKWAYEIMASESSIARILRQHNLTRKHRKKYQRKQDLRAIKAAHYKALDLQQEDVKHLYDIPYYWEQIQRLKLPKYQWTIRDVKSGLMMLGFAQEYSEEYSTILTETYLKHLTSVGMDIHEVTIQTDNGAEFGGLKRRGQTFGFVHTITEQLGASHRYIPPGMSNANADVESVHATIESEFFDIERFRSMDDFWNKVQAYQYFYNCIRPNYSKAGKVPWQIIQEDRPYIDAKLLTFPVINLDKLFRSKNSIKNLSCLRGQDVQKLPENKKYMAKKSFLVTHMFITYTHDIF
jgi:hypothetical protein